MNQAPAPTHGTAGAPTRSVTICRVVGIPIRVHWTFAFLVGLVLVADWDTSASVLLGSAGEEEAARHPSDHGIGHGDPSP